MNKANIIEIMAKEADINKAAAGRALNAFLKALEGNEVIIPGYFSVKFAQRKARTGRNPQTGETINIPARKVVTIKAGKKLKESVNG